jgi:hypothetical protein
MKMRTSFRIAWAVSLLVCLLAMLLMPSVMTVVMRSNATGKQMVRLVSVQMLLALASAAIYRSLLRPPAVASSALWQVVHGSRADLLEMTCVLRC